jgi:Ni/Fe-hydrogenase 1 B-type cytochrome subunit
MSASSEHAGLERIYVWEWPVRLAHWLIVGSILVLAITGLYIGNPFLPVKGEATRHFVMGTMKSIHFIAGMVFLVSVLGRLLWMFAGNPYARWKEFVPTTAERFKGIWNTAAFYVFIKRDAPDFVGHNPLAGAIYVLVYGLCLLMIATGLAMASAGAHVGSLLAWFQFLIPLCGGLQIARLLHHVAMWLILGFAAHHVWSAFLVGTVEKSALIDSIFSGYKVVRPEAARRARERIEKDR